MPSSDSSVRVTSSTSTSSMTSGSATSWSAMIFSASRIAHDQRIGLFVDEQVARLQDRLDQRLHLLRIGIDQMEAPHLEILVILGLGRSVRVDEYCVFRQHFLFQLVLHQDQIDRVFDRCAGGKNRG